MQEQGIINRVVCGGVPVFAADLFYVLQVPAECFKNW